MKPKTILKYFTKFLKRYKKITFISVSTVVYIICSYYTWILIRGAKFETKAPTISYVGQFCESTLNACAMFSFLLFEFGPYYGRVKTIFKRISNVDNRLGLIGMLTNNYPSERFLYLTNLMNILFVLSVLIAHTVVQWIAFGVCALIFTLHNLMPIFLSVWLMIQYGYILNVIKRRFFMINTVLCNMTVIEYEDKPEKGTNKNSFKIYNCIYKLLLVHCDLCEIVECGNHTFSSILLILFIYLLTVMLFRLYTSIQTFWDVLIVYDGVSLMLAIVTLARQLLVHPFVIMLIHFSEHIKTCVSILKVRLKIMIFNIPMAFKIMISKNKNSFM